MLLAGSALLLAASLGAAWFQARAKRALQPEREIAGTPLIVRPPHGWVEDPRRPGVFELYDARVPQGAPADDSLCVRRVEFDYEQLRDYTPPALLLREWTAGAHVRISEPRAANIGALPGLEVRRVEEYQRSGAVYRREAVLRAACGPNGEAVRVVYWPLTGLTLADIDLIDELCAAVTIRGTLYGLSREEVFQKAGLRFNAPHNAAVLLIGPQEYRGVAVIGEADGGPDWALRVWRTWIDETRSPMAMIDDIREIAWRVNPSFVRTRDWSRPDGAQIAALAPATLVPGSLRDRCGAAVVMASPERAAVVGVCAASWRSMAALEAVADVADSLEFTGHGPVGDLPAARARARDFVERLSLRGASAWWGLRDLTRILLTVGQTQRAAIQLARRAIGQGATRTYLGKETFVDEADARYRKIDWRLDPDAAGYEFSLEEGMLGALGAAEPVRWVTESRLGDEVTRRLKVSGQTRELTWSFPPGPTYLAPPAESAAALFVARQGAGDWLFESSSIVARSSCSKLMRAVSPAASGLPRVLVVSDFMPSPNFIEFDPDGEPTGLAREGRWLVPIDDTLGALRRDSLISILRRLASR